MPHVPEVVSAFLHAQPIAVVGVSRKKNQPANLIFLKLKQAGYDVVPVNPHMPEFQGVHCFPTLEAIPDRPQAVFIATNPVISAAIVKECAELGIRKVWFHRSFGVGSVSASALELCRGLGMEVIEGGCPMMFVEPVDIVHTCMRWWLQRTGTAPV